MSNLHTKTNKRMKAYKHVINALTAYPLETNTQLLLVLLTNPAISAVMRDYDNPSNRICKYLVQFRPHTTAPFQCSYCTVSHGTHLHLCYTECTSFGSCVDSPIPSAFRSMATHRKHKTPLLYPEYSLNTHQQQLLLHHVATMTLHNV